MEKIEEVKNCKGICTHRLHLGCYGRGYFELLSWKSPEINELFNPNGCPLKVEPKPDGGRLENIRAISKRYKSGELEIHEALDLAFDFGQARIESLRVEVLKEVEAKLSFTVKFDDKTVTVDRVDWERFWWWLSSEALKATHTGKGDK